MQIGIDPAIVEQASASLSRAQGECDQLIGQLQTAFSTLESTMNAAFASFRTADVGWTAGAGKTAFDEAQVRLKSAFNNLIDQVQATKAPAQNLSNEITRFKVALADSATTMHETDVQIASAWGTA